MAFDDCFLALGCVLLLGLIAMSSFLRRAWFPLVPGTDRLGDGWLVHIGLIALMVRIADKHAHIVEAIQHHLHARRSGGSFLSAVADRFGLWEPRGAPHEAGGDFGHLIAYAGKLISFVPPGARLGAGMDSYGNRDTARHGSDDWISYTDPGCCQRTPVARFRFNEDRRAGR
jgi:hypothetical protein